MGFVQAYSPCAACGIAFFYNPMRVPSIVVNGERQPICRQCIDRINPVRLAKGLPPLEPLAGAYDAAEESEMIWPDDES